MAFAAPAAGAAARTAAGTAARGAGARAGAGAGAAKAAPAKAAPVKASVALPRRSATQMLEAGRSRDEVVRALQQRYQLSPQEAAAALPPEAPQAPAAAVADAAGTETTTPEPRATRRASSSPTIPRSLRRAGQTGGSAILATLGYVLVLTYLRGGSAGVKRWLRAKFLNRVD